MPSPSDSGTPRCLLCSMVCPIGATRDRFGHISTVFPQDMGEDQGACVRGLSAAQLVAAPERIFASRSGGEPVAPEEVIEGLVGFGSRFEASETAMLVDVNRPLEGVLAVAALCKASGARLAAFVPPEDEALVRAGLTTCPPFAEMAGCDLLLAIGDPFSSHPAVAGRVRDMQFGERGNRLVCLDAAWGRTSRGADEALTVNPLKLAGFVAALAVACGADSVANALGRRSAGDICDALGVPEEEVTALAASLKQAKSAGIILSGAAGRFAAPAAVAVAVREMAGALNAKVWPLLSAANSGILQGLQTLAGATGLSGIISDAESGRLKALLVVGCDPASVLPRRLWGQLRERCEAVCFAGSLDGPFAEEADLVIPLALPWEEEGTVLSASGNALEVPAWLPKPSTVVTVRELAERVVAGAGIASLETLHVAAVIAAAASAAPVEELIGLAVLEAALPAAGQAVVVGAPEPQGYTGGMSLAEGSWQTRLAVEERASVSPDLAADLGLADGEAVALRNGMESTVLCEVAARGDGRIVALPSHWPALRELLQWRGADGAIEPAPALANIEKV